MRVSSSAAEVININHRVSGWLPWREYSPDIIPTPAVDPVAIKRLNRVPLNGNTTERFDFSV